MDQILGVLAAFALLLMAGLIVFLIVLGVILHAWPLVAACAAAVALVGVLARDRDPG